MGLHQNPELWPWFVPYATHALNHRFNERTQAIPMKAYRKRLSLPQIKEQFSFNDVVLFKYENESVAKEVWANGTREGLFLNYNHSGSANILCVNNERATRFEVHPKNICTGDDSQRESIIQHIRWALGREDSKLLVNDIQLDGKTYENAENEDYPYTTENNEQTIDEESRKYTVVTRRQKKRILRALNITMETLSKPTQELKTCKAEDSLIRSPLTKRKARVKCIKKWPATKNSLGWSSPTRTLTFHDNVAEYALIDHPKDGVGRFAEVRGGLVMNNSFEANLNDIGKERYRAMLIKNGNVRKIVK